MSPSCVPPHARSGGFVDAWRPSLASTPCQRRLGVTILKARRISNAWDGQAMMDLRLRTGRVSKRGVLRPSSCTRGYRQSPSKLSRWYLTLALPPPLPSGHNLLYLIERRAIISSG